MMNYDVIGIVSWNWRKGSYRYLFFCWSIDEDLLTFWLLFIRVMTWFIWSCIGLWIRECEIGLMVVQRCFDNVFKIDWKNVSEVATCELIALLFFEREPETL
jgi:hypothetical protein